MLFKRFFLCKLVYDACDVLIINFYIKWFAILEKENLHLLQGAVLIWSLTVNF